VAEPARGRVAAGEVSEQRIFRVAVRVEAKATVGRLALVRSVVLNEHAVGEGGKLNQHSSLLSVGAELPAAFCFSVADVINIYGI